MFETHTRWADGPCYYLVAAAPARGDTCLIAGPYRTRAAANSVRPKAVRWAVAEGGDPDAAGYLYRVEERPDGRARSVLGRVEPAAGYDPAAELLAVVHAPDAAPFPYQCLLRDGRCVLVSADFARRVVIPGGYHPADDDPHAIPTDRIPGPVMEAVRRALEGIPAEEAGPAAGDGPEPG